MDPRKDDVMVTEVAFRVKNAGHSSTTGHLWLHFGDASDVQLGYKASQSEKLAPSIKHTYETPFGLVEGKVRYVLPAPTVGKLVWHADSNLIEWQVPLSAGDEANLRLALPFGLVDKKTGEAILKIDQAKKHNEVTAFWTKLQYCGGQITTPDPFVNDYLVAIAGNMAQQVAYRHSTGVWMYKTSPNNYESYWPSNAAKALPAFDYRGLTAINEKVLESFVKTQGSDVGGLARTNMGTGNVLKGEGFDKADGFLSNFGEWTANPLLLSHGLCLWSLAEHYRITRDRTWLGDGKGSPLEAMLAGFDWITHQRQRTKHNGENGKKVPHWGLLPAASAHDWLAGNTIFNDAFCIFGMTNVVRLLREIEHPRAEEMAKELADYRQCLHDRIAEAAAKSVPLPLPDGTSIPYIPRMIGEPDWANVDWTLTGYGPLRAGAWGCLSPDDPLVNQALAFLEAGMPKGRGPYFNPGIFKAGNADANWFDVSDPAAERHYLWRHYVEYETMWPVGLPLFLARDDLPKFFECLFNTLVFVIHQDWRVGVESIDGVPSCAPGDGERWQAIRAMFVNERGGYDGGKQSLWLLQAIPRSWLRPGDHLAVKEMGTSFGGKVDLVADMAADGNSLTVIAKLAGLSVEPKETVIRLRSGDGRPLQYAEVNGSRMPAETGDIIRLPVVKNGEYKIIAHY
jgi:hypothetical protein